MFIWQRHVGTDDNKQFGIILNPGKVVILFIVTEILFELTYWHMFEDVSRWSTCRLSYNTHQKLILLSMQDDGLDHDDKSTHLFAEKLQIIDYN